MDIAYLGIDPGQSGGIAWFDELMRNPEVSKMPGTEADLVALLVGIQAAHAEVFALVEDVHSMPKQGVASSFKFGRNYGTIRGVLAALRVPREFVAPVKWQTEMGCRTKGDKNVSKRRAQELFPSVRVTHAVADALLLAELCRRRRVALSREKTA